MPKAPLLSEDDIEKGLKALPGWERSADEIVKKFTFTNFVQALAFVNRVAEPSEAMNHHPDIAIHWNEVTFTLWTHASGGLTHKDFDLAHEIEGIAAG